MYYVANMTSVQKYKTARYVHVVLHKSNISKLVFKVNP